MGVGTPPGEAIAFVATTGAGYVLGLYTPHGKASQLLGGEIARRPYYGATGVAC